MRRNAILILAVLLTACTGKEQPGRQTDPDNPEIPDTETCYTAVCSDFNSKSHLDGSGRIFFDASDRLYICNAEGKKAAFTTAGKLIDESGQRAVFHGEFEKGEPPCCAIFPYEYADVSEASTDRIVLNVPKKQTYAPSSFGPTSNISAACWAEGDSFTLKNLCGGVKVSFTGKASICKVVIEDNDPEVVLWGKCTAVPDGKSEITDVQFSNGAEDRNSIEMESDTPVVISDGGTADFYFNVPEDAFSKGVTVSAYDEGGELLKSIILEGDYTVVRDAIKSIPAIDINASSIFSGGDGSKEKPYLIAGADDLVKMAELVNTASGTYSSASYRLFKDIKNVALPTFIGTGEAHPFSGTFDGNGHTISNISFISTSQQSGNKGAGLFGYARNATFNGLTVDGFSSDGISGDCQAAIAGYCDGCTFTGCSVSGTMTFTGMESGAIAGYAVNTTFNGCSSGAKITSRGKSGGLVGHITGESKITDCRFTGSISSSAECCGGILGIEESSLEESVSNCRFNGVVNAPNAKNVGGIIGLKGANSSSVKSCTAEGSVTGSMNVGGIIGGSDTSTPRTFTVSACVNKASITASSEHIGGIFGFPVCAGPGSTMTIDKCRNSGNVTGKCNMGGVVGYEDTFYGKEVRITNCVCSKCTLTATSHVTSGYPRLGGIIGGTEKGSSTSEGQKSGDCIILNCASFDVKYVSKYTGSKVRGIGGIVGCHTVPGMIENCYSSMLASDLTVSASSKEMVGAIAGTTKVTSSSKAAYFDSKYQYGGESYGTAIETADFKNGKLLELLNGNLGKYEGASQWETDSEGSGYPVPSGATSGGGGGGDDIDKPLIRILVIGNSYSEDGVEDYLWDLLYEAGYNAVIGNAYISGCSLQEHWEREISSDEKRKNYNSYRKIVSGVKNTKADKSLEYILQDEPWEYVAFQQGRGAGGVVDSHYPYLDYLIEYVGKYLKKGTYKLGYQMLWGYPKNSTQDFFFKYYDGDQMTMWKACAECAKTLKERSGLDFIVPVGTAIQNGRTTSLGDTFNRDAIHLLKSYGRYTAACTWAGLLTGKDVTTFSYRPYNVTESQAVLCRKAAQQAIVSPYSVTEIKN